MRGPVVLGERRAQRTRLDEAIVVAPLEFLMLLQLLAACSTLTAGPPAAPGTLHGRVVLDDGTPVSGAEVSVRASTFTTDVDGTFDVTGLSDGEVEVRVRAATTSSAQATVAITAGETTDALFQVLPLQSATLPDAGAGGTVTTPEGLELVFPPNAVVDESGDLVSGSIELHYALFDSNLDLRAAPGGLKTADGVPLVSNGMVELRATQAGMDLGLVRPVEMSFDVIGNDAPCGAEFGLYRYDASAGTWASQTGGRVVEARFAATIDDFGYWNCDAAAAGDGCIDVTLRRHGGALAFTQVGVWLSNGTIATPVTSADGAIRVPARPGETVTVGVVYDAQGRTDAAEADAIWSLGPIEVPAAGDGCAELGEVAVTGVDQDRDGVAIQPWGDECDDHDATTTERCAGAAEMGDSGGRGTADTCP